MNDLRPDTAVVGVGDQEEVVELQAKISFHAQRGIVFKVAAS